LPRFQRLSGNDQLSRIARGRPIAGRGFGLLRALALVLALPALPGCADDKAPGGSPNTLFLTGQLLVATPDTTDPRFAETVIYMITHRPDGASGLIVNKVLGRGPIAEFLKGFNINTGAAEGTIRFHYGGPVEPQLGFILHTSDYDGPKTRVIDERVSLTTELHVLKAIAEGKGPRHSLLALGYSGWSGGQLEAEIARGDWLSAPADEKLIFDDDLDSKWKRASQKAGHKL